ncbi:hypothetical protein BDW74DRAFT_13457 [Aspergillus multicolor]|uniref:uncharacterized protein n=1 Tax=Aspergillus multicolor TaxID=41759 RepID=UPI003CCCBB78
MKYPRKYLDQWHGQTAPEKAVKPFLQIRKEMGRTVPGFEGLPDSVECYNIPSGFTPGSAIPSEDMKGEEKWVHPLPRSKRDDLYMDPKCVDWLAQWGCYLADVSPSDYASPTASPNVRGDGTGPMQEDQNICDQLLTDKLDSPTGTLFDDASWNAVRNAARGHNAPGIMNLVGNLIVPSAEFAGFREPEVTVKHLKDAVCHYWDWACPFDENSERLPHRYAVNLPAMGYKPPIPQPDYTAGFHQDAFGPGRKDAMDDAARYFESPLPFEPAARCKMSGHSFTCVIRKLVFPFLTAETKQAPSNEEKATLETAERQNAHSMAVAMRNIIAICKRSFPKRVRKLHRRILGFSISYDHKSVRIHAHYPRIKFNPNDDEIMKITYHSWVVKEEFQWITDKDKWTAYKFVMNVYKTWVPDHQHRLREMLKGLQAWNLIHNNLIDEARINVNGDGLSTPAVQDPDVPDVDFKLLKRLRKDHRRALRQAGRSRTPAGSDVPSVGDKVQLIEVRKGQPRHHST